MNTQTSNNDSAQSGASLPPRNGSAFRWKVGTVQLFIIRDTPFLHLGVMLPEYDSKKPVGCRWERAVVQWACDYLNARSNRSELWEDDVKAAIKLGEQAVPYTPNDDLSGGAAINKKGPNETRATSKDLQEITAAFKHAEVRRNECWEIYRTLRNKNEASNDGGER